MKKEDQLNNLFEKIEYYRKWWRIPLFIIGAGVSIDKVPLMDDIFQYFCDFNGLPQKLDALKLRNNKQYQSRATASNFFGALQTSKDPNIKQSWAKFTRDLLEGRVKKIAATKQTSLWNQEPSYFHEIVALQVVRNQLPGICLSLNYDGLTAKAIKKVAYEKNNSKKLCKEGVEPLYPCRILTTKEEIMEYYGRIGLTDDFYPIIKLRGDIFSAICSTEGCKYYKKRIPIYEIYSPIQTSNKTRNFKKDQSQLFLLPISSYEEVMKCRGCGEERSAEIDFPGYRTKELETNKIIEMIYRFIVSSLSCIVVCGVSGNWDLEIIEFLRVCSIERGLKIYCLDIEKPPLLQYHLYWAIEGTMDNNEKANFIPIQFDFSEFDKKSIETK